MRNALVLLLFLPAQAAPVLVENGNLKTLLQTITIPGSGTHVFQLPSELRHSDLYFHLAQGIQD